MANQPSRPFGHQVAGAAAVLVAAAFAGGDAARAQSSAPVATLALTPATIDESGAMNSTTVTATLDKASTAVTTIEVSAAPVSPATGADFTLSSTTTLTIAAGQTASTGTVTITAVDDSAASADKQVTVTGAAANSAGVTGPAAATLTIEDDETTEITVLVAYTDGARAAVGGTRKMTDAIDLRIADANTAFSASGIHIRLRLVHTVEVDYDQDSSHLYYDLVRIMSKTDGHLDAIHELRNRYQADLVSLLVRRQQGAGGIANRLEYVSGSFEKDAFSIVPIVRSSMTFAHELGHNLGLAHDRWTGCCYPRPTLYAYGYVNKEAFKAGAPASARWRTIMSYHLRCSDAGFGCTQLNRFSNPDQSHLGDALGVPASSTVTGADGPADARSTLNYTRTPVSLHRSICTDVTLASTLGAVSTWYVPLEGETVSFDVRARVPCAWEATADAGSEFLVVTPEGWMNGNGKVAVTVPASATERTGTLTAAGLTVTVKQTANPPGSCGRTPRVILEIMRQIPGAANCADVTSAQLASITRLNLGGRRIETLKKGDFDALTGVKSVNLASNRLTAFPEDLFADMSSSLEKLYARNNRLTTLRADAFDGLSRLKVLNLANNSLKTLPPMVFDGLSGLNHLHLSNGSLVELPDGVFSGLSGLRSVRLDGHPGAPFTLDLELSSSAVPGAPPETSTSVAVSLPLAAPFPMQVGLEAEGGWLSDSVLGLEVGATTTGMATLTHSSNDPALVSIASPPPVPAGKCSVEVSWANRQMRDCFSGLSTRAGPPLVVCSASRCPADVSFGAATYGLAGGGSVTVPVTLSETFGREVVVPVEATSSGAGSSRFSVTGDSVTFAAGESAAALTVSAAASGDDAETLTLVFGNLPWLVKRAHPTATATVGIDNAVAAQSPSLPVRIASDARYPATGPFTVTFTFSESVLDFTASDIEVANGAGSNFQGSGADYSLTVTPNAGFVGTLTVRVPAGAARSIGGRRSTAQAASFAVDPSRPVVTGLELTSNPGTDRLYAAGDRIRIAVALSDTAKVTGAPYLSLTVGNRVRSAAYRGGDGTATLRFEYQVASGDEDADGVSVAAGRIRRNGGAITNADGRSFGLRHEALSVQAGHRVDGVAPTLRISSSASFPVTAPFTVDLEFSESVSGLTASDISVTNGAQSALQGNGADYSLTVTPNLASTRDVIVLVPQGAARDRAGNGNRLRIRVFSTDPVRDPSITSGASFTVAENETAVTRLAWSDPDTVDNVAAWSIAGGADRSFFGLDSTTGDLSFLAAPDHERPLDAASTSPASGAGDNEYVVTARVSTGTGTRQGTAEKTLTVTVTDASPPATPAAPSVSEATASSLTASWTAPANTGPAFKGYDLQYRASGDADFEDAGQRGPALSATLPGLQADTEYEVRVRAVNAEGESDWSPSGRGRTSRAGGDGGGPGGPGGGGSGGGGGAPPPDDDRDDGGGSGGGGGGGGPPRAAISVDAECADGLCRALTGAPVRFQDKSTGAVRMRLWDFGDGRQSRNASLNHAWAEPGFYRATLWTGDGGSESTAALTFLVEAAEPAGTCAPDAETRCLGDSRYSVSVEWRTADGGSGPARVVRSGTNESGLFAFFDPANWEALVKVVDGCALNGHAWVFAASTTDLGYTIRIADTATGTLREYRNSPGVQAPAVTDVEAFAEGCR